MTGETGVFQLPGAGRARGRRARRPHVGHDGTPQAGRDHLRQHPRQRARARAGDAARRRRALAVPAAARPRRRPDGLPALGDHGHDRRARAAAVRRRGGRADAARRRDHDRLARADAAAEAARRRRHARARGCAACCSAAARSRTCCSSAPAPRASRSCPSYGLTQACSTVTVAEPGDLETAGRPLQGRRRGDRRRRGDPRLRRHGQRAGQPAHGRPRPDRRAGPPRRHRPQVRRDHHGRRERLPGGGRGRAARAPGRGARPRSSPGRTRSGARRSPPGSWPTPGAELDAASLRAHCLERLAGFKVPKTFELVDELPRTESGKVRRTRAALASRRRVAAPRRLPHREPQALGRAGGGLGGAARRSCAPARCPSRPG